MVQSIILVCLIAAVAWGQRSNLPNTDVYEPTRRPENPTRARDILGYDSFQRNPKSYNNVQHGNNWEQYETPPLRYNPEYAPDRFRNDRRNSGRDLYQEGGSRRDRYDDRDYEDSYRNYRRY